MAKVKILSENELTEALVIQVDDEGRQGAQCFGCREVITDYSYQDMIELAGDHVDRCSEL